MLAWLTRILLALRSVIEARASREAEILVLRQQLLVLNRAASARSRLRNIDRLKLVWLSRLRLSSVLALEILAPWRQAQDRSRTPRADPPDEQRESDLGRTPDPWRAADAWHRCQ
ncbi:MAG: hypothetical protein WBQ86_02120 [Candidatus Binatus sp.]